MAFKYERLGDLLRRIEEEESGEAARRAQVELERAQAYQSYQVGMARLLNSSASLVGSKEFISTPVKADPMYR